MVLFPMSLSDPNYRKLPHFRHFVSPFIVSGDRKFKFGELMVASASHGWQTIPERAVLGHVNHVNVGGHQRSLEWLIVSGADNLGGRSLW